MEKQYKIIVTGSIEVKKEMIISIPYDEDEVIDKITEITENLTKEDFIGYCPFEAKLLETDWEESIN